MVHSWKDNANALVLNADLSKTLLGFYNPDWKSPPWSQFNAANPFRGLPQTFVQVCGGDVIRDDGIIWARALADHGVETRFAGYEGAPHCFWTELPQLDISRKFLDDAAKGVGWLLGRDPSIQLIRKIMRYPRTA